MVDESMAPSKWYKFRFLSASKDGEDVKSILVKKKKEHKSSLREMDEIPKSIEIKYHLPLRATRTSLPECSFLSLSREFCSASLEVLGSKHQKQRISIIS
jgi:hypothetical protein